jgi:hypothetical protein
MGFSRGFSKASLYYPRTLAYIAMQDHAANCRMVLEKGKGDNIDMDI